MGRDDEREFLQVWHNKSELEQVLATGLHGPPEIKKDEKRQCLGVFREQVIALLKTKQIKEAAIYPEIGQALKDSRCSEMIINGGIDSCFIKKYQLLAKNMHKHYRIVSNPDYAEQTALVIVSAEAVDIKNIEIEDRDIRLRRLGASDALIQAAGKKVCEDCLTQIIAIDPAENINYDELTWLDSIAGEHCPVHDKKTSE
jgi:uncharacterized protein YueI